MTPERWKKITEVYQSALEIEPGDRGDYLARECGEDTTLRREVESLLDADAGAGDFISENAYRRVGELLGDKEVTLSPGKKVGHYEIVTKIGVGGMGEVYLARDTKLNRQVAVKTLPLYFAFNNDYLQRFQTEVKAAASLNHPNVATVYSVEEIDGLPFFTMEYVEGEPLNSIFSRGPISVEYFLDIFIKLAEAFSHAHRKGVVHRDIKPGNIIIQPDGNPKVLDFGLAYLDRDEHERSVTGSSLTLPGQILGTPAYMSPEQAEGKPVDQRSDIFSLGIVMYQAITGEKPFGGDNYASVVSKLLRSEPISVTDLKPDIPFLLSRLIKRCLEKSPRKRFQSMDEVRVILEEVRAVVDAGISMDPSSADRMVTGRRKISWPLVIVPLGFLAAFAIIAGFSLFGDLGATEKFRVENFSFRKLSQTNDVVFAAVNPSGTSVAFNTIEPNGDRSLWIRLVEDRNALRLVGPETVHYWGGLTFSNDGSQIYYITAQKDARSGTLYRISALGGSPRELDDNVNDVGSLSPDGSKLLFVRYRDTMQLISANAIDGSAEKVISTGDASTIFRDPQYSSDGLKIYLIKVSEVNDEGIWTLVELPAEGGEERVIIEGRKERINEVVALKDGTGLLVNALDPVSNLAQLYFVDPDDGTQTRITNDLNEYFGISVSDDGNTIVAAQRIDEKYIWLGTGTDLAEFTRLTNEPTFYRWIEWMPDGRIVYDAVDNNRPHIWTMNADGTNKQQLTSDDSRDQKPTVSKDGSLIFFMSDRSGEFKVWQMGADGTSPSIVVERPGIMENPVATPDGKYLLFDCPEGLQLVLCRLDLSTRKLDVLERYSDRVYAISPDGKKVAYPFFDPSKNRFVVGIREIEKREPEKVLDISPIGVLIWTPDGEGLVYRDLGMGENAELTIWYSPVDGGEPVPYVSSRTEKLYRVAISPDGQRKLAITRNILTDAVMLRREGPRN
ncbi:MAG: hypothetical protein DWQ47_07610 [Acidobacteria bacterium]|nr:MAG: hypothetical protein DWQ32_15710 [Acidobacteriota bacterium]REJ99212.1 MAG: hypothetical protein DWQ38_14265 [Acidobacteriota bacterium]REK16067.1 MAG: hypothetical protein DWQ43_03420 [Acidobacteriota bacterium]REK43748.1 MAG: hypothetical protein DWQ47_07610 [Acidobacteriota bacterium]